MKNKQFEAMRKMMRINRKIFSAQEDTGNHRLGSGQVTIIGAVIDHEGISQDELAKTLQLDKSTVAKAVKRLESHGLLIRQHAAEDKRRKELYATEKALQVREQMIKRIAENNAVIFEGITGQEMETLDRVLGKIEANIERKKENMRNQRHQAMKVLRTIARNEGLTIEKVAELSEVEPAAVGNMVNRLVKRGTVIEENGQLSVSEEARKRHAGRRGSKGGRRGSRPEASGRRQEYGSLVRQILSEPESTAPELAEKTGKSSEDLQPVLDRLIERGLLEERDGKLYPNKEALAEVREKRNRSHTKGRRPHGRHKPDTEPQD